MSILLLTLYAAAILAASVGLSAMPAVVIAREGGMGIGSALIVAQTAQLGALVLGAVAAAYLVDRALGVIAVIAAAAMVVIAFTIVALPPGGHHGQAVLPSQLLAHTLGGGGLGLLLTAAFARAAADEARFRALAIAVLLLAAPAARVASTVVDVGDGATLVVASVVVAGASLLALTLGRARRPRTDATRAHARSSRPAVWPAALAGVLMAVGAFIATAGADASLVTVAFLAAPLRVTNPEVFASAATGMVLAGLVIALAGALAISANHVFDRATLAAALALLLVAFAVSGTPAAAAFAASDGTVPGQRSPTAVGLAPLAGIAAGILLGGMWLARGGRTRVVVTTGCVVLAGAALSVIAALLLPLQAAMAPGPLVALLVIIGLGGGLAAQTLRLALADVASDRRGRAGALGVVAAAFGAALGNATGNGAGLATLTDGVGGGTVGLLLLAFVAVATVGISSVMRPTSWR